MTSFDIKSRMSITAKTTIKCGVISERANESILHLANSADDDDDDRHHHDH